MEMCGYKLKPLPQGILSAIVMLQQELSLCSAQHSSRCRFPAASKIRSAQGLGSRMVGEVVQRGLDPYAL
jgi:hypothetical protein